MGEIPQRGFLAPSGAVPGPAGSARCRLSRRWDRNQSSRCFLCVRNKAAAMGTASPRLATGLRTLAAPLSPLPTTVAQRPTSKRRRPPAGGGQGQRAELRGTARTGRGGWRGSGVHPLPPTPTGAAGGKPQPAAEWCCRGSSPTTEGDESGEHIAKSKRTKRGGTLRTKPSVNAKAGEGGGRRRDPVTYGAPVAAPLFPAGPMRRLLLLHLQPAAAALVQPGQLEVPVGRAAISIARGHETLSLTQTTPAPAPRHW